MGNIGEVVGNILVVGNIVVVLLQSPVYLLQADLQPCINIIHHLYHKYIQVHIRFRYLFLTYISTSNTMNNIFSKWMGKISSRSTFSPWNSMFGNSTYILNHNT